MDWISDELRYISDQITKAERKGWFDHVNYPSAINCMGLLKEIRSHCDKVLADEKESREIDQQYPWPEPL